jgi:hypothetical protein
MEAADQQQPADTDSMLEAGSQRSACARDQSVVPPQEQREQQGQEQHWQLVDLHEQQQLGQLQEQLSRGSTSTGSSRL